MLSGGHPKSLGRTLEVVEIILNVEGSLNYSFECYSSSDANERLRVSNASKRIFRQPPNLLIEYVEKFQIKEWLLFITIQYKKVPYSIRDLTRFFIKKVGIQMQTSQSFLIPPLLN